MRAPAKGQSAGRRFLGTLGVLAVFAAPGVAFVLAFPTWRYLGPVLAGRPGWQHAAAGLLAGAVVAAPAGLLGRTPRWATPLLALYLWTAGWYVLTGIPMYGRGFVADQHVFAAQAGWYVVTTPVGFVLGGVAAIMPAAVSRGSGDEVSRRGPGRPRR